MLANISRPHLCDQEERASKDEPAPQLRLGALEPKVAPALQLAGAGRRPRVLGGRPQREEGAERKDAHAE